MEPHATVSSWRVAKAKFVVDEQAEIAATDVEEGTVAYF
jgi:hypothetical protein